MNASGLKIMIDVVWKKRMMKDKKTLFAEERGLRSSTSSDRGRPEILTCPPCSGEISDRVSEVYALRSLLTYYDDWAALVSSGSTRTIFEGTSM
ncbi:hypothetical protein Tco_0525226 [Tanacetum coccineum]